MFGSLIWLVLWWICVIFVLVMLVYWLIGGVLWYCVRVILMWLYCLRLLYRLICGCVMWGCCWGCLLNVVCICVGYWVCLILVRFRLVVNCVGVVVSCGWMICRLRMNGCCCVCGWIWFVCSGVVICICGGVCLG